MKHKHADFIKAWADGAQVQFLSRNHGWLDVPDVHSWSSDEYRIKPVLIKYRVAQMENGVDAVQTLSGAVFLETSSSFIRWLTDWVEA